MTFNPFFDENLQRGQTITYTTENDWLAHDVYGECDEVQYDRLSYISSSYRFGRISEVATDNCLPLITTLEGKDGYDLALKSAARFNVRADVAFARHMDWQIWTGTQFGTFDKTTGKHKVAIVKYSEEPTDTGADAPYIWTGAKHIAPGTFKNQFEYINKVWKDLVDEVNHVQYDLVSGAVDENGNTVPPTDAKFKPDTFNYLRMRNKSDFKLVLDSDIIFNINSFPFASSALPNFRMAETPITDITPHYDIGMVGRYDQAVDIFSIPKDLMTGDGEIKRSFGFIDTKAFAGGVAAQRQWFGTGYDKKHPWEYSYVKRYIWDFTNFDRLFGNYTRWGEALAEQTPNTVVSTQNVAVTGSVTTSAAPSPASPVDLVNAVMAVISTTGDTTMAKKASAYLDAQANQEDVTEEPTE